MTIDEYLAGAPLPDGDNEDASVFPRGSGMPDELDEYDELEALLELDCYDGPMGDA